MADLILKNYGTEMGVLRILKALTALRLADLLCKVSALFPRQEMFGIRSVWWGVRVAEGVPTGHASTPWKVCRAQVLEGSTKCEAF